MDDAHNLILVDGTGTGKIHLATALDIAAIHHEKWLRYFNAVDLVNLLEQEKQLNKTGNLARKLIQAGAIILNEWAICLSPNQAARYCFISSPNHMSALRSL